MKQVDIMESVVSGIEKQIFDEWKHEGFIGGWTSKHISARLVSESDGLFRKKDDEWQQRYEKITPQMILEVYDEAAAIAEGD